MREKTEKRFEVIYTQGIADVIRILVDRETGVNYLQSISGNAGGLTPLLTREGKPVITRTGVVSRVFRKIGMQAPG